MPEVTIDGKAPEVSARIELINSHLEKIAQVYRENLPSPTEQALIALSLLRTLHENCQLDKEPYPTSMILQTSQGGAVTYKIFKPNALDLPGVAKIQVPKEGFDA